MSLFSHRGALSVVIVAWMTRVLPALHGEATLQLSAPLDYQVVQRESDGGFIPVTGAVIGESRPPDLVEARWVAAAGSGPWQPLRLRGGPTFAGAVLAPAGGWYRLEVRARSADFVAAQVVVEHVGVGEVWVVAGQSNSANHGEERQEPKSGLVSTFDGRRWRLARDPQPGASGEGGSFLPPLGDALVERLKVPVGFVATGVGATSVREWLPRGSRFKQPPTLTDNVSQLPAGDWESKGHVFDRFSVRLRALGPRGFRAVLWHQGESDANQADPTRTLPGESYRQFLTQLIQDSRRESGWDAPWFVAQVSYHTPTDSGSPEIRAAQKEVWDAGIALEGPDSDALVGDLRDGGGQGVHFSTKGLREHAARWAEKILPWLDRQRLAAAQPVAAFRAAPPGRLVLPGESFTVAGRPAFIFLPPQSRRSKPQPWIFYAPTLRAYPDEAERWMHEQFLAAGIAVAGVDVGEAYGSPQSHATFDALHRELTQQRAFAPRPCLFGRSRGGLWVTSWAIQNPARVAGIIGIYPVFDFRTYPGLTNTASAYGVTPAELSRRAAEWNPIERVDTLARARVAASLLHGDVDVVVPLRENSARFKSIYEAAGVADLVKLIVLPGQGHRLLRWVLPFTGTGRFRHSPGPARSPLRVRD